MAIRFAIVTDVHFGPPARFRGALRKLSAKAPDLVRAFVERMNEVDRPDVIVNLGDVVEDVDEDADRANYAEFTSLLDRADAPVIHVAGNHDSVNLTDRELRVLWGHDGELHYTRAVNGVRFVVLRTVDHGLEVRVPSRQLAWLERGLGEWGEPVVVLMHHPAGKMDLTGNRWFEWWPHLCRVANRRDLRRTLEASDRVLAVFNGHAHWNHTSVVGGVPYVTVQSLIENLDDDAPGRAASAWAVVDIDDTDIRVRVAGLEPLEHRFSRRS